LFIDSYQGSFKPYADSLVQGMMFYKLTTK